MKRVLLTGAAGHIGTSLRNSLTPKYLFRCLDTTQVVGEEDVVVCDVADFESLSAAMDGVDAVIHLAGKPGFDQPWKDIHESGIAGTYNVFEAARRAGVKKVIYASSTAVLGWRATHEKRKASPAMAVHPVNLYGVGKAVGEMLARYFAETYGMSIICLRIGSFHVEPPLPQSFGDYILWAWCSPEDLAQLVELCLETDGLGFQIFYGVSNNKRRLWDIENARRLVGYRPRSNAEDLIRVAKRSQPDRMAREHVLLTNAALEESQAALKSWRQWLETVDIESESLDTLSYRLLPLVYHNLAGQKIDHPLMGRLKGTYRRAWLENQLSLQQLIPFITQLHARGIPVLLLDDLTSILRLYDGQGARRPYSLDILVQPGDVVRLIRFLEESRVWPKVSYGGRFLQVETPLEVWPPFDLPLTVAWRVFSAIRTPTAALAAWEHRDSVVLGECPVFVLDLECHFLRCCARAIGAKPEAAFFAWVDVAWMLKHQTDKIDWDRVVELATLHNQVLPFIETLRGVAANLEIAKAHELLQKAQTLPVSLMDRMEHRVIDRYQPFASLTSRTFRRLLLFRRSPKLPGRLGYLRYFEFIWGAPGLRSIPRMVIRHLRNSLTLRP